MIRPLETEDLIEFAKLIPQEYIYSMEFKMFNGTETRGKELPNGVYVSNPGFSMSGKYLQQMLDALKLVDYNQIQRINIVVRTENTYRTCTIDALERSLHMGGTDLVDFTVLKNFCKAKGIEKLSIHL